MFQGLDNSVLYSATKLTSRFFRQADGQKRQKDGTGFFVKNKAGVLSLVTNRHMLDFGYEPGHPAERAGFTLEEVDISVFVLEMASDVSDMPTIRATATIDARANPAVFASDYANDVAAIVNPQFEFDRQDGVRFDYFINHHVVANETWINEKLTVCDFVGFTGFPEWFDHAEKRPIFRTGTVASDPRSNYSYSGKSEGDRVAYEAFSFEGSSGSPVFAFRKSGSSAEGFREAKLIGVNARHLNGAFGHSGVSVFYKSHVILQIIDDVAGTAG
ncbi:hypothetical protein PQR12_07625 [Paraburkholderia nemoris]|uniref:hypothetical protein n=1 Tax=Paraburkholderia nemoris TaxID=2793076 RepID=UPI0038B9E7B3